MSPPGEEIIMNAKHLIWGLTAASLVGLWPGTAAAADAVITWNENAAKAANAACIHISGNGLAESRMYAMVHVAVHDAVNAIDRRSRPYAFDANVNGLVSADAAVAAAARDVLVSVIAKLPESPACVASGILEANALYAAALVLIPDGPAKTAGVATGQAAAAAISRCEPAMDPRRRRGSISTIPRGRNPVSGASRPMVRPWRSRPTMAR